MNKYFFAAASGLGLAALAGGANAQEFSTGFLGVNYTSVDTVQSYGASGNGSFSVSDQFEIQVDGTIDSVQASGINDPMVWGVTGHGFYDSGNLKGGVFYGYTDLDNDGTFTGFGVEGRVALSDNWTFGASYGRGQIEHDTISSIDLDALRAEFSMFLNDRTRADISLIDGDIDFNSVGLAGVSYHAYGLGLEHQLEDFPFSIVVNYAVLATGNDPLIGSDSADSWTLGIRRVFGGNLKDRDRTSSPMPDIGTAFAGGSASAVVLSYDSLVKAGVFDFLDEEPDDEGETND